jgi:hypothetical protein
MVPLDTLINQTENLFVIRSKDQTRGEGVRSSALCTHPHTTNQHTEEGGGEV